jgi:hypothetical protein
MPQKLGAPEPVIPTITIHNASCDSFDGEKKKPRQPDPSGPGQHIGEDWFKKAGYKMRKYDPHAAVHPLAIVTSVQIVAIPMTPGSQSSNVSSIGW